MDQSKLCLTNWVNSLRNIFMIPSVAFRQGLNWKRVKRERMLDKESGAWAVLLALLPNSLLSAAFNL